MRLVTFAVRGQSRLGAISHDAVVDLNAAYTALLRSRGTTRPEARAAAAVPADMVGLLDGEAPAMAAAAEALRFAEAEAKRDGAGTRRAGLLHDLGEVALRAPVPNPRKIICLGLNYRDHAEETGMAIPAVPILFSKFSNALIGPGEPIRIPRATSQVDYEAELAVVIGRRGKEVPEDRAYDHVAGYTCFNDVSGRDYQMRTSQWLAGKAFDTFAPTGPWLVTRDEIPDPHALDIHCRVAGETLQSSNTRHLIFTIPYTIHFLSQIMTLEPGDIIATGTPGGVGFARKPPRFLRPGETVEIVIQDVGTLANPVVADEG
ncbi:MAG: fumarylacetoacetate hydrolase family protein [Armatimonadetes bacterium]|nr:fumarylacetoacetate hydrolase family protein [Armatimonadota bacterium]